MLLRLAVSFLIALALPSPSPTPLKTITHVRAQRLCTGLKRSVYPAVGRVLQDDKLIADSRPLFRDYVKESATGNKSAVDLDVMRLERYITPLVQNTQAIEAALNDPVFPAHAQSQSDQDLLDMRTRLQEVLAEQKQALDLISGFTDTQQLGELQQEGSEDQNAASPRQTAPPQGAPTEAPNEILNAGIPNPQRSSDPRYMTTNSLEGFNPLNAFDQQMDQYQQQITSSENDTSQTIFKAVAECGGKAP
jgi:hypothetical protein